MVLDATIMDAIPLLAMKYPIPRVMKNAGVISVDVITGVIKLDTSCEKTFDNNVSSYMCNQLV